MKKFLLCSILFAVILGSAFALGVTDGNTSSQIVTRSRASRAGLQSSGSSEETVHEADDLPAVPDLVFYPEANTRNQSATGSLYAKPSSGLKAIDENLPIPSYAISGVKGQKLDAELRRQPNPNNRRISNSYAETVDLFVNVGENDYFVRDIREGYDATTWIQNLPEGLRARAHAIKADKKPRELSFYITGIPKTAQRSNITVVIPAGFLHSGGSKTFVSSTKELENTTQGEN